jgi:antibiotic biosynthesis monooxygenase (ABM) superfamily enzyme
MDGHHVAITRIVRSGQEAQFERALRDFISRSLSAPGVTGALMIGPVQGATRQEYGILRSFATEAASCDFYTSDLYRDWEEEIATLVEGPPTMRRLHGLEAFFRNERGAPPPKWKMALLTWLGVVPTVLLWSSLLTGPLQALPVLLRAAIINACVVITLAWIAMPLITRAFSKWLVTGTR